EQPLASHAVPTKPAWSRSVGANEPAHPPLAASGPYLPSLSFAPSARHHLRQEPYAGNPPVRIRAGGTEKSVSLPRQHSSGAKHRAYSGTKLNAGSRLHYPHRSRGLYPGSKLLRRLFRLILRIFIRAFTDAQCGSDLLGLWRLQKVLEVAVFRKDIVERFIHNIVGGCVDE